MGSSAVLFPLQSLLGSSSQLALLRTLLPAVRSDLSSVWLPAQNSCPLIALRRVFGAVLLNIAFRPDGAGRFTRSSRCLAPQVGSGLGPKSLQGTDPESRTSIQVTLWWCGLEVPLEAKWGRSNYSFGVIKVTNLAGERRHEVNLLG